MNIAFVGKVAVVTGAARGIGRAIAEHMCAGGARVLLVDRDADGVVRAAQSIGASDGSNAHCLVADLSDPASINVLAGDIKASATKVDILVNNAGITIDKLALDLTTADWDKVVTVNLSGAFHMAQAALGHMLERGTGRIISVSSIAGEIGNVGQANYAASKSGLLGLTKALARETAFLLARSGRLTPDTIGLTVNAVAPGLIATEMLDSVPAAALARLTTQIPCGRLGRPEEVARIVHVLAADASSYITGQVWSVNGGMDM